MILMQKSIFFFYYVVIIVTKKNRANVPLWTCYWYNLWRTFPPLHYHYLPGSTLPTTQKGEAEAYLGPDA